MAINFSNINDLINYANNNITNNGKNEISGDENNNVLVGLANFIKSYNINESLADVISSGTNILLNRPISIIAGGNPSSVAWSNNVQNMYYIVNSLGRDVDLAPGLSYYDPALIEKTSIAAQSVVQIAKIENGNWVQVNIPSTGGGTTFQPGETTSVNNDLVSGLLVSTVNVSPDSGNAAEIRNNGLYVQPEGSDLEGGDTASAETSVASGLILTTVKLSPDSGNAAEQRGNGIYVPPNASDLEGGDTTSAETSVASGLILTTVRLSPDAGNAAEQRGNGIFVDQSPGTGGTYEGDADLL